MTNLTMPTNKTMPVERVKTAPGETVSSAVSFLNILAGIWMIIAPFVIGFTNLQAAMWNTIIVGALVLLFAWIRTAHSGQYRGLSWLNFLLGIWAIVSPSIFGFSDSVLATNNSEILGVTILIVAIWSVATSPSAESQ